MKKYLLVLFSLLVFLSMYLYSKKDPMGTSASPNTPEQAIPTEDKTMNIDNKHIKKNITSTPSSNKTPKKPTHVPQTIKEPQTIPMYETLSIEEASLTTKPRQNIAPTSAIRIDNDTLSGLAPHDTLLLPNIEGNDYAILISYVQTHADGSVSTTGYYEDEGIKYTTTMTQSKDESFIAFSSAQGQYEIETRNEVGYIYRTDAIRKQLQNPHLNDVIILPIPEKVSN